MRVRSALELPPHLRDQVHAAMAASPPVSKSQKEPGRQKYGSQAVEVDGKQYQSKWELTRHMQLMESAAAGVIANVRHQVELPLHVVDPAGNRIYVCSFVCDFVYDRLGLPVYEDTKSEATRRKEAYRIKAKMFEAEYRVKLLEVVRAPRRRKNREVRA